MKHTKKAIELQGIKGYAFLLVFFSHCKILLDEDGINRFSWFGACGVLIFLYLGGFLLLYNYNNSNNKNVLSLKKICLKIWKIWPLHILTLLFSIPLVYANGVVVNIKEIIRIISNVTLVHGFIPKSSFYFSYNAVSWYLSVYFLCLLVGPLIIKVWNKVNSIKGIVLSLSACVCLEITWYIISTKLGMAHWLIYIAPPIRIIDFMIGGGLFLLRNQLNNRLKVDCVCWKVIFNFSLVILGILLFVSVGSGDEIFSVVAWTVPVSLFIVSFISVVENSRFWQIIFKNRFIVMLGDYGLELFLFHQLVIRYIDLFLKNIVEIWIIRYFMALIISILIAIGYNKLLKRLIYKRINRIETQ